MRAQTFTHPIGAPIGPFDRDVKEFCKDKNVVSITDGIVQAVVTNNCIVTEAQIVRTVVYAEKGEIDAKAYEAVIQRTVLNYIDRNISNE